jgi:SMC interacting uncharacterized protein involved in chromosome segregation
MGHKVKGPTPGSGRDSQTASFKCHIRCLKYELRKLKSVSSEVQIVEERRFEIASPSNIEKLHHEAKEAQHEATTLATELADTKKSAEERKSAADDAKTAQSVPSEVEEEVSSLKLDVPCLKYELTKLKSD